MNLWHDIAPARVRPEDVFRGQLRSRRARKNKYEMDKETGALRLDRILYTSTHYPANYGFMPPHLGGRRRPAGRSGSLL